MSWNNFGVNDPCSYKRYLHSSDEKAWTGLNLDLCDANAVLHHLSDPMICLSGTYKCKGHLHHNNCFQLFKYLHYLCTIYL